MNVKVLSFMNNTIQIRIICDNLNTLIYYLSRNNIKFDHLYSKKDDHYFKIYKNDYKRIKRKFKKVRVVGYYGKESILKFIKTNYIFLLSLILGLTILYFLSTTMFFIEIHTNNEELSNKLYYELGTYNIKKYGRIKSYKELDKIKKEILKNNQDKLEWLEIKREGTKYEVLLTERVIPNNDDIINSPRHIVASKDALIKHITSNNGVVLKDINDYVKKGEIIISGDLYKGETYIKSLRASGEVYGEVWYTVKTVVPYKYVEYVRTGKVINHYYLDFLGNKMTLIGKYNTNMSMNNIKLLVDKPYLGIKIYKETKELYDYKEFKVTKDEAYIEAIKRSDKSIKNKLKDKEYIISKKVLNISPMSSKIEVEVFYKVYENITDTSLIEEKKEL